MVSIHLLYSFLPLESWPCGGKHSTALDGVHDAAEVPMPVRRHDCGHARRHQPCAEVRVAELRSMTNTNVRESLKQQFFFWQAQTL